MSDTGESLDAALAEEERSAIAAAEEKLRSVQKDLEELKDRHLRKLAEFENLRKRSEREKQRVLPLRARRTSPGLPADRRQLRAGPRARHRRGSRERFRPGRRS